MTREPELKTYKDGTKKWFLNGELHRTSGPAIIQSDGTERWYLNGKLHCTSGPAMVRANGTKYWMFNGEIHRTSGPAVIWADGTELWYLNGHRIESWAEYQEQTNCSSEDLMYLKLKYGDI